MRKIKKKGDFLKTKINLEKNINKIWAYQFKIWKY